MLSAGVDLSNGPDGLGFYVPPISKYELADQLDLDNTTGIACSAHHDLLTEFPARDALLSDVYTHPNFANAAVGLAYIFYIRDCK